MKVLIFKYFREKMSTFYTYINYYTAYKKIGRVILADLVTFIYLSYFLMPMSFL